MKIILSRAGGGKTAKIAELMAELSHEGKESLIITNELNVSEFKEYAIRAEANLDKLRYTYAQTLGDILEAIKNKEDENVKTIFVDFTFTLSSLDLTFSEHLEKLLTALYNAGEDHGKSLYVTMQTGLNNEHLGDKKLVVIDY